MKFTKTLLTTAILGFSLASFHSTAWADTPEQQFQQGFKALDRGDYQTALKLWIPLAEQGYASAQTTVGIMYYDGRGTPQNFFEAMQWFRRAAERGNNAMAQFYLGKMYYNGEGVKRNYFEAAQWYQKAAQQGEVRSQGILGLLYASGKGVQRNRALAREWLGKACSNGYSEACNAYGKLNRGEL